MHYYQVDGGGFGLSLSYNSTSWIAVSLIIAVGCWKSAASGIIRWINVDLALLLVFIVLLIPLLWSESPWRETTYDRYLGVIAFLLVIFSRRQFILTAEQQQVFWAIIAGAALIQGVLGVVQLMAPEYFHFVKNGRPVGTMLQANVYGSFTATGLAISLHQILAGSLSQRLKLLHYSVVFICVFVEYAVSSRTGIIGALLSVITMFFLYRSETKRVLTLSFVIIIAISAALLQSFISEGNFERENINVVSTRSIFYSLSLDIIKEAPLKGHGLGKFSTVYADRLVALLDENPGFINYPSMPSHPHNELLFWGVEAGLLIVLVMMMFAAYFTWNTWLKGTIHNKAAWVCMFPIALHTQTELPFYISAPHIVLFALLLSQAIPCKIVFSVKSLDFLSKSLAIVLVMLTSAFMISNLHTTLMLSRYNESRNPVYLDNIINPMAQQSIILLRRVELLMHIATPEAFDIVEYITKAQIKLSPNDAMYFFLYKAQSRNGKLKEAMLTKARAQQLFPDSGIFKQFK
jgi:O-antigen polymerase